MRHIFPMAQNNFRGLRKNSPPARGREVLIFAALFFLFILLSLPAFAGDSIDTKSATGLPVPRFASLRSGNANMRTGPGTRYPIKWVYTHQGLPVEITAEYDIWRRVRDPEGTEGWIHKTELSGKRTGIVINGAHDLLQDANDNAAPAAHLDSGAVGQITSCAKDWCKLRFEGNVKGYLRKTNFWGAYAAEIFD